LLIYILNIYFYGFDDKGNFYSGIILSSDKDYGKTAKQRQRRHTSAYVDEPMTQSTKIMLE
jgi:hypothetical protein